MNFLTMINGRDSIALSNMDSLLSRFIFNPEIAVEKFPDSFILKINEKELLVEFSAEAEKKLFEELLENKLHQTVFSESFAQLVNVLIENELLFKIPELPAALSKSVKFKQPADVALKYNLKEVIYSNQYIELLHILESKKLLSIQEMKALSLVYRIFGQQKKELPLLKKIVAEGVTDDYYLQRVRQYNDNSNSLLVPRKVISSDFQLDDTINKIISENKLCFVTASNSKYFTLLVECVGSILSCKNFTTCPIYVADCGLSNQNIAELKRLSSRIDVLDVSEVFAANKITLSEDDRYLTGILFRGFFQELFPDYDFCFFIDADAWMQDETGIYDYLKLSIKQGIAIPSHPSDSLITESRHWLKRNTLTPDQTKTVIGFPAIIACCFCANIKSNQYQDYRDCLIKNIGELGINWGIDQETFLYIAAKYKLSILPTEYAYEGNPMLKIEEDGSHLLFTKEEKLIKIYHLGGGRKHPERKQTCFTDANLVSPDSKIQLSTSVRFLVPEWRNGSIVAEQLKQLFHN